MTEVSRRSVFVTGGILAGGMGALALAASDRADAAESSAVERANTQLVKDFCQAWGEDPPDADKIANEFLAENCTVRFGDTIAPAVGHSAAADLFKSFLNNGERYELKIVETFARGPIVVNSRIDSTIKGKRYTNPTPVIGVFEIRDGKIKEWSDYV